MFSCCGDAACCCPGLFSTFSQDSEHWVFLEVASGGGRGGGGKSPSATTRKFLKGCCVTVAYACLNKHPSLRTKKNKSRF